MKGLEILLENELLTDEVKTEVTNAWSTMLTEAQETAQKEAQVKYAQKLAEQQEAISTDLMRIINESVDSEFSEIKNDVKTAIGMEPKYAAKLEEQVSAYQAELSADFDQKIQSIVQEEVSELIDEISEATNARLGMRMFESVQAQFGEFFKTSDAGKEVVTAKAEAKEATEKLTENVSEVNTLKARLKTAELTADLSGKAKDVMTTILEDVAAEDQEARFDEVLSSVLNESLAKDDKPLVEDSNGDAKPADGVILESVQDEESEEIKDLRKRLARLRR